MNLSRYNEAQLRLVYRVIAFNNSRRLWGTPASEGARVPDGKEVIRDALARALFDAPPVMFEGFRYTVCDGRAAPCDPAPMLADRIIAELEHAGYRLKSDRHNKNPDPTRARMILQDHLIFAMEITKRAFRETLDSPDRAKATSARAAMTTRICETFNLMNVRLGKLRR